VPFTHHQLEPVAALTARAEAALRTAVALNPLHSDAWTALGTCSSLHPLLQQHCLCRAAQIDHSPSGWANLALLYLRWPGKEGAAYEALGGLQAVVDHPVMWVALGVLREREVRLQVLLLLLLLSLL
jgi:hypothetical protein